MNRGLFPAGVEAQSFQSYPIGLMNMNAYESAKRLLKQEPKSWLVTGVAGFIGSNLLEYLLKLEQKVIGLDNFSSGRESCLAEVRRLVTPNQWKNFKFVLGDICDKDVCQRLCESVDFVLHHAALSSVPQSLDNPIATNETNVGGFLNMLKASYECGVKRFVYASSSAIYGDFIGLPNTEADIGSPLSPYAVSKRANELYAEAFARSYGFKSIGLRYFNVFGKRQNPNSSYAAVIPRWISAMSAGEQVHIYGDGKTTRDFCYVENIVQANVLAASTPNILAMGEIFNIATGVETSLNELHGFLENLMNRRVENFQPCRPIYLDFRAGDIKYSVAAIDKSKELLGYEPTHTVLSGLEEIMLNGVD